MLICYAFTPDFKFRQMAQTTWQTSMLYLGIVPLIYVNGTICVVIGPSTRFKSIVLWPGMNWCQNYHKMQCMDEGPGVILNFKTFFSLTDWERLYNIQLKTSRGALLLPPSDAYVRSFLYLLYTLIKVYYTKALSDPASSLASRLLQRPRILASYPSASAFHTEGHR